MFFLHLKKRGKKLIVNYIIWLSLWRCSHVYWLDVCSYMFTKTYKYKIISWAAWWKKKSFGFDIKRRDQVQTLQRYTLYKLLYCSGLRVFICKNEDDNFVKENEVTCIKMTHMMHRRGGVQQMLTEFQVKPKEPIITYIKKTVTSSLLCECILFVHLEG